MFEGLREGGRKILAKAEAREGASVIATDINAETLAELSAAGIGEILKDFG